MVRPMLLRPGLILKIVLFWLIQQWEGPSKRIFLVMGEWLWLSLTKKPYDMVTVRGKVVEQITGPVAEEHIDKLAKKYIGKDKYPGRGPGEKRILLKIEPEKVSHMKQ